MSDKVYIVGGLGNPGEKYCGTRHNVGFDVVDYIASRFGETVSNNKWDAETCKVRFGESLIHYVKPMTYMNRSGKAIVRFMDYYKVPVERIVIIHDDLDMPVGRLKFTHGGGSGGHNGIKSIISMVGGNSFFRLKIGIGRPGNGGISEKIPVERFVLTSFHQDEVTIVEERMGEIYTGLEIFFKNGPLQAMNHLNKFK